MTRIDKQQVRAAIRLAAEHVQNHPPTDWGPEYTVHDVFARMVYELLDLLDDRLTRDRLEALIRQEAGA